MQSTERVRGASTSPSVTGYTSGVPFIQSTQASPAQTHVVRWAIAPYIFREERLYSELLGPQLRAHLWLWRSTMLCLVAPGQGSCVCALGLLLSSPAQDFTGALANSFLLWRNSTNKEHISFCRFCATMKTGFAGKRLCPFKWNC